jgi:hypothetical protein
MYLFLLLSATYSEANIYHYRWNMSGLKTTLLVIALTVVATLATVWVTTHYLFPKQFTPVTLDHKEQQVLDTKLQRLHIQLGVAPPAPHKKEAAPATPAPVLKPERYSEENAPREVTFTEREINAMIANNTDLASKLAIDLSQDLISAVLLVPMDPDMPVFGGKTLKINAGLELRYKSGKPVVILKGVSLWGVPLPDSWLGDIKNIDLVHEYGDEGFWKAFAAGVEDIAVADGKLTVKLKK